MRVLLWIFIIFILVAGILYAAYLVIESRIRFDFDLKGLDPSKFLTKLLKGRIDVDIKVTVTNKNNFNIPISNLYIELFYNNQLVANSIDRSSLLNIKANDKTALSHWVDLNLSENTFELLKKIVKKEEPEVYYIVRGKLWFIPFKIKNSFKA